jgi:hypothetical protein
MAKKDAALPLCYIVPYVATRSICALSHAGNSIARWGRIWQCSFTFPRSFQCGNGVNLWYKLSSVVRANNNG